jgi:MraZ protein
MAFRGLYEHSLDSKDRLTIPSKLRAQLAEGVVIAASFDTCIEIHPVSGFATYAADLKAKLNPLGKDARMLRRRINYRAQEEQIDSAGRVKIPKLLLEHGGLEGPCVIAGADSHLEVWSPERWAEQVELMDAEADAIAEALGEGDWAAG